MCFKNFPNFQHLPSSILANDNRSQNIHQNKLPKLAK